ncbi:MAG: hypothetical protein ACUVTX_10390 [Bacteroidales bacterium]
MKNNLPVIKVKNLTIAIIIAALIPVSMTINPPLQDKKVVPGKDKKADILERMEKGENVAIDDVKSVLKSDTEEESAYYREEPDTNIPFYGFNPWFNYDFQFEIPEFPEIMPFPEFPDFPEIPPYISDERYHHSYKWNYYPPIDEEELGRIREEMSRAMEGVQKNLEKLRKDDFMRIQEEMSKAVEELKKEVEKEKEKLKESGNNKAGKQSHPII